MGVTRDGLMSWQVLASVDNRIPRVSLPKLLNSPKMAAPKSSPKDAQVMAAILKDMGVMDHEPRVVNQMLEFAYRYVTDVLDDAKIYSSHSGKKNLDVEDVKLAVQCKLDHSFTTPPPRDLLMDVAKHKNNNPLPLIKPYTGPKLPPDRYCLNQPNYRLRTSKKPKLTTPIIGSTIAPTPRFTLQQAPQLKTGTSVLGGGTPVSIIPRAGVSQPTITLRPASATPAPLIRLNTGGASLGHPVTLSTTDLSGIKRKREDDDYDV